VFSEIFIYLACTGTPSVKTCGNSAHAAYNTRSVL
jgi:hypothetical protein